MGLAVKWAYAFIMLSLGAFEGGWGAEFAKRVCLIGGTFGDRSTWKPS